MQQRPHPRLHHHVSLVSLEDLCVVAARLKRRGFDICNDAELFSEASQYPPRNHPFTYVFHRLAVPVIDIVR